MKNVRDRQKDRVTLRWIFNASKGQWQYVALYAVLNSAMAFFGVIMTYGTKGVINGANDRDLALLKSSAVYLLVLLFIMLCLRLIGKNLYERARAKTEIKLKSYVFNLILKKDYSQISHYHSGEILNRLTSDVIVITDGIMNLAPNLLSLITRLVMAVIIMIGLDPLFAVIFVAAGLALMIASKFFRSYLKKMHKLSQETDGKVRSFFQEAVAQILVVKVFNAYEQITAKAAELMNKNYAVRMKRASASIFANSSIQLAFSFGYLFAMVWGGYRVYSGVINIGELTAILQLVNQIQSPMASLSSILPTYYSILASAERLMEFGELDDELDSGEEIENIGEYYGSMSEISIDCVSFKYDGETVLENASASVKKGEFAAVTGVSGMGKSTLLKLILGVIYPQSGEINIISGGKKRQADRQTRRLFAYVPQGNLLLSGTVRENITFMSSGKTEQEINRAVELSCCNDFIDELPDGLESFIGERGAGLSEGQVQRIAIARAILNDAPVLLLDEATSALDEETELKLLKNLKQLKDKTVIIITHKKAALSFCNKELRIADKKIETVTADSEVLL